MTNTELAKAHGAIFECKSEHWHDNKTATVKMTIAQLDAYTAAAIAAAIAQPVQPAIMTNTMHEAVYRAIDKLDDDGDEHGVAADLRHAHPSARHPDRRRSGKYGNQGGW